MILDSQNQYSSAQALSGAGSAASTNIIDHGVKRNLGIGEPMSVVIVFTTALSGTSPTFTAAVQTAATGDSAFGSPTTIEQMPATISAAAVGARVIIPLPDDVGVDRYTRVNYTLGGTSPACGVTAYLEPTRMLQNDGQFAAGYSIS